MTLEKDPCVSVYQRPFVTFAAKVGREPKPHLRLSAAKDCFYERLLKKSCYASLSNSPQLFFVEFDLRSARQPSG